MNGGNSDQDVGQAVLTCSPLRLVVDRSKAMVQCYEMVHETLGSGIALYNIQST
jgi:hypothetical protein